MRALVCAVILATCGIVLIAALRLTPRYSERIGASLVVITFAVIGAFIGEVSGLSRTPVAGTVIPAILTLIGGVSLYLFSVNKADVLIVNVSVIIFVLSCLVSYNKAAMVRSIGDDVEFCLTKYYEVSKTGNTTAMTLFEGKFGEYCNERFRRSTH